MNNTIIPHLFLSFVIAGVWIGTATLVSERCGSKVGGLIGNLPSNIVVSFIFITLTQNISFTVRASQAVPIGMLIDTVFILIFVLGLRWGLRAAIPLSLLGWVLMAFAANSAGMPRWWAGATLYIAGALGIFFFMDKILKIKIISGIRMRYSPMQLGGRMVFAGCVVAGSVLVAKLAGPFWAGLFSTFPAVLLSTLVILTYAQGREFAQGTAKILALSSTNILAFAFMAALAFPRLGLCLGTIAAYGASIVWVVCLRPAIARTS